MDSRNIFCGRSHIVNIFQTGDVTPSKNESSS